MKKISLFFAVTCLLALVSCSKETEIYNAEAANDAAVKANVEKVFGITFDPNHDWKTITSGELTIQADATVTDVMLVVKVREIYDEVSDDVTREGIRLLNQAKTNGRTTIKMSYDAPKDNLGLYVVFVTNKGNIMQKVESNTVSIAAAQARATRALSTGYILPQGDFKIAAAIKSYANERGWVPGEMLYELSEEDYEKLKMNSPQYSETFKDHFQTFVLDYLQNKVYNLDLIMGTDNYKANAYPVTTGEEPIIVTPIYKCDNADKYGNEVYNSDLYYYYYEGTAMDNMDDAQKAAFLKALPKYKAIPFNKCFGDTMADDDVLGKRGSFALLYFENAEVGAVGSFKFPEGYKIGFMVRAKTEYEAPKKQGEVYGDGLLNDPINTHKDYNFKTSKLKATDPRATWLDIDQKLLMSWESGTDADFNDIVLEVEGGIDGPMPPHLYPQTFTYCFEDTDQGDYDMNDVVIKAVRTNETTVEYSIMACGAYDALYIKNLQYNSISDTPDLANTEVHALFGFDDTKHFINTTGVDFEPVTFTRTVNKEFKLAEETETTQPYIYNQSTDKVIKLSKKGEDPHGIMVAWDFCYPRERVCVKDAFPLFNNWGTNLITDTWWYMFPIEEKVIVRYKE